MFPSQTAPSLMYDVLHAIMDKTIDYTLLHCLCSTLRLTNQKPYSFYDHLPPSPPNTMLNICQIVITRKATLIGGGMGEVSFRMLQ